MQCERRCVPALRPMQAPVSPAAASAPPSGPQPRVGSVGVVGSAGIVGFARCASAAASVPPSTPLLQDMTPCPPAHAASASRHLRGLAQLREHLGALRRPNLFCCICPLSPSERSPCGRRPEGGPRTAPCLGALGPCIQLCHGKPMVCLLDCNNLIFN